MSKEYLYSVQSYSMSKENPLYETYLDFCISARDLYNQSLFYIRNAFTGGNKLKNDTVLHENEIDVINFINGNIDICQRKDGKTFKKIDKSNYVLSYEHLQKLLYKTKNEVYFGNNLLPQTRNKVIKLAYQNMKSFLASVKDYKKSKDKYKGKPNLPKYRKPNQWVTFEIPSQSGQIVKAEDGYYFRIKSEDLKDKIGRRFYIGKEIHSGTLEKTSISYEYDKIVFRFTFKEEVLPTLKEDNNRYLGIDLGVSNFATISNNIGQRPIVIKGNIIKSKNQWYNKRKSILQERYMKCQTSKKFKEFLYKSMTPEEIEKDKNSKGIYITSKQLNSLSRNRDNYFHDIFHKISKYIVSYAINNDISKIIIGSNKDWKQEVNMTKKNNQNFVSIPYHKFIKILKDKAFRNGIEVITVDESYTSKSSILDLDILPIYEKNSNKNFHFSGTRKSRSYYSKVYGHIHSDVNGASNIIRRYNDKSFLNQDLFYLQQHPLGIREPIYIM